MKLQAVKLQKTGRQVFVSVLRALFLIALSYILVYPLVYMISNGLKSPADIGDPNVMWVPKYPTWDNFNYALKVTDYLESFKNTVIYELGAAVIEVFSCAVFAYGLSRFKMRFKSVMVFLLIVTIFIPEIMLLVPRMLTYKQLDLFGILGLFNKFTGIDLRPNIIDTPFAFYLPSLFGVGLKGGLMIFIYMQFYKSLPYELEEAAWMDGAGPFTTFLKIILPSSGVAMLTVFIFSVIWHWNDFLLALVYTYENRTLAVVINDIRQYMFLVLQYNVSNNDSYGIPLAACVLYILPPLILYAFLQRKFIQSIDRIGIVG